MYCIRRIRISSLTKVAASITALISLPLVGVIVFFLAISGEDSNTYLVFAGIGWLGSIVMVSAMVSLAAFMYNWLAPYIGFLRLRIENSPQI